MEFTSNRYVVFSRFGNLLRHYFLVAGCPHSHRRAESTYSKRPSYSIVVLRFIYFSRGKWNGSASVYSNFSTTSTAQGIYRQSENGKMNVRDGKNNQEICDWSWW